MQIFRAHGRHSQPHVPVYPDSGAPRCGQMALRRGVQLAVLSQLFNHYRHQVKTSWITRFLTEEASGFILANWRVSWITFPTMCNMLKFCTNFCTSFPLLPTTRNVQWVRQDLTSKTKQLHWTTWPVLLVTCKYAHVFQIYLLSFCILVFLETHLMHCPYQSTFILFGTIANAEVHFLSDSCVILSGMYRSIHEKTGWQARRCLVNSTKRPLPLCCGNSTLSMWGLVKV